ncbi:hypothetical protein BpHYR1_019073 [Brachionus plicatilis]|uniref:Uncharacterized protein n=1 Tax=Brachionus plicatilis TaxID=10195 RepID=A0A3M7S7J9_BRAPC|nr:hypothetical protein BpHYR1_019073 [Brachionus plicatilis]
MRLDELRKEIFEELKNILKSLVENPQLKLAEALSEVNMFSASYQFESMSGIYSYVKITCLIIQFKLNNIQTESQNNSLSKNVLTEKKLVLSESIRPKIENDKKRVDSRFVTFAFNNSQEFPKYSSTKKSDQINDVNNFISRIKEKATDVSSTIKNSIGDILDDQDSTDRPETMFQKLKRTLSSSFSVKKTSNENLSKLVNQIGNSVLRNDEALSSYALMYCNFTTNSDPNPIWQKLLNSDGKEKITNGKRRVKVKRINENKVKKRDELKIGSAIKSSVEDIFNEQKSLNEPKNQSLMHIIKRSSSFLFSSMRGCEVRFNSIISIQQNLNNF